ncbi:LysR family transcriptional regulator [soil metagenome]
MSRKLISEPAKHPPPATRRVSGDTSSSHEAIESGVSSRINLRHLNVFLSVAEHGGISRAAESLYRVSSAVTRSIGDLEREVGVPLFERKPRGLLLGAFGEAVLVRARRIQAEFAALHAGLAQRGFNAGDPKSIITSMFNGRRLAVLVSLARTHSMAAVAREFGLSQPAISAMLKDLEGRLGTPLFERSARGVIPTAAGALLILHISRVLAELRNIAPDIAAMQGTLTGRINVGALPLCRTHILPTAIAALTASHPRLRVFSEESPYPALLASLHNGDIDFILGALRPGSEREGLLQETLFQDKLSLVARAGHPLAGRRVTFDELYRVAWTLSRQGSPSRDLMERSFLEAGRPCPEPTVETGDLAILRGLLQQSDMVTAISPGQLHYEIESGTLVELDFDLGGTSRYIGITMRAGAAPSPGSRALLDAIRDVVREQVIERANERANEQVSDHVSEQVSEQVSERTNQPISSSAK